MEKKTQETINKEVDALAQGDLQAHREMIRRGAQLHYFPTETMSSDELTSEEKEAVTNEKAYRWNQPLSLYLLVAIGALAAVAQVCARVVN
jgi:hypothetical protein